MTRRWPDAVVFDCDGTLVDSERISEEATRAALATLGHELVEEDLVAIVGRPWAANRSYFSRRWSMDDDELTTYAERYRELAVPRFADPAIVFDDVAGVVEELAARGLPMAVCTSSTRAHLDTVLGLPPLRGRFAVTVAAEDTDRHKPHPAPYRRALDELGRLLGAPPDPGVVAVVEDSEAGVAAATAAGCWTVAVDRGSGLHDLRAADVVVERVTTDALVVG